MKNKTFNKWEIGVLITVHVMLTIASMLIGGQAALSNNTQLATAGVAGFAFFGYNALAATYLPTK